MQSNSQYKYLLSTFTSHELKHRSLVYAVCYATKAFLCILMQLSSPQLLPQELFTNQYLVPSSSTPYSTAVTAWSRSVPLVPVNTPAEQIWKGDLQTLQLVILLIATGNWEESDFVFKCPLPHFMRKPNRITNVV